MRIAVIKKEKCNPEICNYACIRFCPLVRSGKKAIFIGEDEKPRIDEKLCIACGICAKKCPQHAIEIERLPDELKEDLVFSYGSNAFKLFRIPLPRKGKVIGLIGRNGMGKTTCIKLLAGKLKPTQLKEKEWIEYFRMLDEGKIKISIKPQEIMELSKFNVKVGELLDEEALMEFSLQHLKDRKLAELSGGELQKVAIAKCLSMKVDFHLLDEPTAFLDIKERFDLARKIFELKDCLLIDHDLLFLDYACDLIHVLYGRQGCFGIVSLPYSNRVAINDYIRGYLRAERMRIRDFELTFKAKGEVEATQNILVQWEDLEKRLDGFSLKVQGGFIREKEIICCIGPNGIGKTTFARMLVGELKPDRGSIKEAISISYKPQYISPVEGKVGEILGKYEIDLLKGILRLDELWEKEVSKLSGGEPQRFWIAKCLAADADLYVLDEPSAFLDVEERINVARAIKEKLKGKSASAIIIDHDLLFILFLAQRLLLFLGKPGEHGEARLHEVREGINEFLKWMGVTMRRDIETGRPRINKPGSAKDREQKAKGIYFEL